MTATRRAATIAALAGGWVLLAALLWRTSVPGDLDPPAIDVSASFADSHLQRAERYERFLRATRLLSTLVQVGVALALASWAPSLSRRLRGRALARGVTLAALVFASLWLARLPFGLAAHWWRRRYDIAREGYLDWLVRPWTTVVAELVLACVAVGALMLLARRLGPRWWLAGAGVVTMLGIAYVVVQPLVLAPRFAPLEDSAVRADVERLARRLGVDEVDVRLRKASERTRAANAEVVGLGPTRRIVLWDTLLEGGFTRPEIEAISAHELAHVSERHVWKGLGWFLLAVGPAVWLLDRAARLRGGLGRPEAVPAVLAAGLMLQLALAPAVNLLARRYEAEADWVALEATRDPEAMQALFRRLAVTNLADPEPPGWWAATFRTHPTLADRLAMAQAWAARNGAGRATSSPSVQP